MRTMTRMAGTTALTGALLVGTAGAAVAHECMIASRSQQAQQAVGASPMWLSEDMATTASYEFTFVVVYGVEPTAAMLDDAVARHVEERGTDDWAAFFLHHTLLTNPRTHADNPAAAGHAGDGRGVDHWSDTEVGQTMIRIAGEVLADHS